MSRHLSLNLDRRVRNRLRWLAMDMGTTERRLLRRAIVGLFVEHG